MSQLVNRVGQSPKKDSIPGQAQPLPAPFLQEEASLDWSLHSRRAQVTGKNDAGLSAGRYIIWASLRSIRRPSEV